MRNWNHIHMEAFFSFRRKVYPACRRSGVQNSPVHSELRCVCVRSGVPYRCHHFVRQPSPEPRRAERPGTEQKCVWGFASCLTCVWIPYRSISSASSRFLISAVYAPPINIILRSNLVAAGRSPQRKDLASATRQDAVPMRSLLLFSMLGKVNIALARLLNFPFPHTRLHAE
jgi:hypothetical protein